MDTEPLLFWYNDRGKSLSSQQDRECYSWTGSTWRTSRLTHMPLGSLSLQGIFDKWAEGHKAGGHSQLYLQMPDGVRYAVAEQEDCGGYALRRIKSEGRASEATEPEPKTLAPEAVIRCLQDMIGLPTPAPGVGVEF